MLLPLVCGLLRAPSPDVLAALVNRPQYEHKLTSPEPLPSRLGVLCVCPSLSTAEPRSRLIPVVRIHLSGESRVQGLRGQSQNQTIR
jgi:hypothetical protein